MKRRTFIKSLAAVVIAGGMSLAAVRTIEYSARQKLIREGNIRSEEELRELERLALETQKDISLPDTNRTSVKLTGFLGYEHSFQIAIGTHFTYEKYLLKLKRNFPFDRYLFVADIGGSVGTAAEELQKIDGVEAFVIDPFEMNSLKGTPEKVKGLPKNRFFIRKIEETGLPDESFHFMTSYNSYQYMKFPKSFTEPYRLLKKGGGALIQIAQFGNLDFLKQVNTLDFRDNMHVAFGALEGEPKIVPFSAFIKGPEAVYKEYGDKAEAMLQMILNPAFIIDKR